MKFFKEVESIEDLKKAYRKLAFKFHPDKGGSTEKMAAINAEYEVIFKKFTTDEVGNNKYSLDDGFREMIDKIINIQGLEIEICGLWVWVSGNTREYKNILKEAGFFWASKKMMWYWRPAEAKIRRSSGIKDMDYIRNMYGSEKIKTNNFKKAITA